MIFLLAAGAVAPRAVAAREAPPRVAVFPPVGDAGLRAPLEQAARAAGDLAVLDSGLVDAASRGAGYDGSLNMWREEARRLASVVGADALVLASGTVLERATDNENERFDGFLATFFVDGRSGELVRYRGLRAAGPGRTEAAARLVRSASAEAAAWGPAWREAARRREAAQRGGGEGAAALDLVDDPDGPPGAIPPRFFKRPVPAFTDDADRAHAVATVDLVVRFNADATYGPIEVARWAGYGLDESAVAAVRAANFWPARRDGKPVDARGLLRFNFRFRDR